MPKQWNAWIIQQKSAVHNIKWKFLKTLGIRYVVVKWYTSLAFDASIFRMLNLFYTSPMEIEIYRKVPALHFTWI